MPLENWEWGRERERRKGTRMWKERIKTHLTVCISVKAVLLVEMCAAYLLACIYRSTSPSARMCVLVAVLHDEGICDNFFQTDSDNIHSLNICRCTAFQANEHMHFTLSLVLCYGSFTRRERKKKHEQHIVRVCQNYCIFDLQPEPNRKTHNQCVLAHWAAAAGGVVYSRIHSNLIWHWLLYYCPFLQFPLELFAYISFHLFVIWLREWTFALAKIKWDI